MLAVMVMVGPVAAAPTPGLDELRDEVGSLTARYHELESELHQLDADIAQNEARLQEINSQVDLHRTSVIQTAVVGFTRSYQTPVVLHAEDLAEGVRAEGLSDAAVGKDDDAIDRYSAALAELQLIEAALDDNRARQAQTVEEVGRLRDALLSDLEELEAIEAARLEEIRQRAERAVQQGHTFIELEVCPVAGAHSFIDSWGFARSGGRRHKGVDMMANVGVPLVAPVSGTVSHRGNRVGGLSYHLRGDDGHYYYGTHLSAYGESGYVTAGTVIGYVGDTGNASGIPHLHFEIHPNNGSATNPYPSVAFVCSGAS
ncbi:MAG: peptidoglycan DD-metalloendopeptidase family protein [Acidimicrobiales bacterium]|nr:peptidoglycan DD-metalloendopeptidase family protein [Acidimicrobiales bacterium]